MKNRIRDMGRNPYPSAAVDADEEEPMDFATQCCFNFFLVLSVIFFPIPLLFGIKQVAEYERGVLLRFGKAQVQYL